ncbi:MAG: Phage integrase, N-terminal SAM-like domain, partial [Chthoniobacter sp.]|nr:Phage integrase, N-terminal SAM-like domain [Chthoniobacter sp.]
MKKTRFKKPRAALAAVTEKPKGLYRRGTTYWLTWRQNGEKKFTSLYTEDFAEACVLATKILACPAFQSGTRISDEQTRFLNEKDAGSHYSRHTGEWAATPIKQFAEFCGDKNVTAVTGDDIRGFWESLLNRTVRGGKKMSETSAASYMRALRSFFSWLLSKHAITQHPFKGFTLPKIADAARLVFCEATLRNELVKDAPTWDLEYILRAGMEAGMRKMEIIEAVPKWFDLDRGFVVIDRTPTFKPKDRERRSVPMTKSFLDFMRKARDEGRMEGPWVLKPEVIHGSALYRYDFRVPFMC